MHTNGLWILVVTTESFNQALIAVSPLHSSLMPVVILFVAGSIGSTWPVLLAPTGNSDVTCSGFSSFFIELWALAFFFLCSGGDI